ncbi:hypothetical protein HDV03_003566 [Kappamyces sp. JEL0829]|nr:hypothetical protein HDV03_003566 [Kappamyces sp. JEL0829]
MSFETDLPNLPKAGMTTKKLDAGHARNASMIDDDRKRQQAYDYLCHIGEAKEWIEACLKEDIPRTEDLEEALRNGITLAYLAKFFQPSCVKKIFEDKTKLQFRHSDNINFFFQACKAERLPEVFFFELTDLYEKKNIPKVIYCIHALSYLLAKAGKAPNIKNLVGKLSFSEDILNATAAGLDEAAVAMPAFGNISHDLDKELNQESEEEKQARLAREEEVARQAEAERLRLEEQERSRIAEETARRARSAAVKIQAVAKGHLARKAYKTKLGEFKSNEKLFTKLQARFKGKKARAAFNALKSDYKAKEPHIVKLQAWWRGVIARRDYKDLRLKRGKADVKVVQKFLHLLESQDDSYDEEKLVEELRGKVIQKIRENVASEAELNELDSKVALLVKNRITLEEVAGFKSKDMRAALAKNAAAQEKEAGILSLKGNDKDTKKKKRSYEELFYVLQTQPQYLSSLMFIVNKTSGANATKFLEQVVLTLYGYAQNSREEYLFLKMIEECIQLEVNESTKPNDTIKENPLFIKLVLQYTRGPKERDFLRGLLRPLLETIMSDNQLELDTDPVSIYKGVIREEEATTGEKSSRPAEVTPERALEDAAVKNIYLANLAKLKTFTDSFLTGIVQSVNKMPFGIRYISMKMKEKLLAKFPDAASEVDLVIGNLLYYRYINPVIVSPEAFDVIESVVSPVQRKNLGEVAKSLNNIAVQKTANNDSDFSTYLQESAPKFAKFIKEASNTVASEEFFGIDEFHDSGAQVQGKLTVYITPDEVVQVHHSLVENLQQLPSSPEDPLRVILNEMGIPPALGTAAKGPGSEIVLRLFNRFGKIGGDENAPVRKLLKDTKRLVLLIIRFSAGKSLLDILEQVATSQQEVSFAAWVEQQDAIHKSHQRTDSGAKSPHSPDALHDQPVVLPIWKNPVDESNLTFAQIKILALENMAKLEEFEVVSKKDHYQSMLDKIVEDMLTKQRRRTYIHRELLSLRKTMFNLEEKSTYLADSAKSYHDYIDACMAQLSNKKGKGKKPMLFSKQYYHEQSLKKSGMVPKFGSFKYTAAELHKKGVLISIDGTPASKFGMINLTISSDEAGVFSMEVTLLGASVAEKEVLKLEDLLQNQYNKVDVVTLFEVAKINVNLLIFLLNKKFYL